jgi:hypothetical protein
MECSEEGIALDLKVKERVKIVQDVAAELRSAQRASSSALTVMVTESSIRMSFRKVGASVWALLIPMEMA